MAEEVILRFNEVTFEYAYNKPILDEAGFSIRRKSKITLMGQNGAGKSTIFGLIQGQLKPKKGEVSVTGHASIGAAFHQAGQTDLNVIYSESMDALRMKPAGARN